jgi:hypothetical protein
VAAEKLLAPTVDINRRLLGDEHPLTLLGMITLGSTYNKQGRWQDTEALYQQVATIQRRLLDCGHCTDLSGALTLAEVYGA